MSECATRGAGINDAGHVPVDLFDEQGRFVTSAGCAIAIRADGGWSGVLTSVEPNKHLGSGRYRLRTRDGVEAVITVQARQRIRGREQYPFTGSGPAPSAGNGDA